MLLIYFLCAGIQIHIVCVSDIFVCRLFVRYSPINKLSSSFKGDLENLVFGCWVGFFFPDVHCPAGIYFTSSLGENRVICGLFFKKKKENPIV